MRVLLIGSDKVYSIENFYVRHFREAGVEVENFPAQRYFYDYYQKNLLHKLIFKAGLSSVIKDINKQLLDKIDAFQPDIVWVFKGMEIYPSTLEIIRNKGIKLVNYNPDNPFIFTGSGSGNKFITQSIHLYDLHFTYNLAIRDKLEKDYNVQTAFLPFGFELSNEEYERFRQEPEIRRVCFLGNPDKQRIAFLQELAAQGIDIDLYGHGWVRFARHPKLRIFDAVYKEDFWKVLRRYRVQLNLLRIHNEDSHNMRTFEVPGIGGILLAPATTEHKLFFNDRENAFLYTDLKDCVEKIKFLLSLSQKEADEIRDKAREKSLSAGYTYKDRAMEAVKVLQEVYA